MPSPTRIDATNLQGDPTSLVNLQTGHQSYEEFRKALDLPSANGDGPSTLPLPKLPIPPFEVPASVLAAEAAAAAARNAEESELDAMTLQPGASRDATQSPKTCRLRMDNFVEPDSEDEDAAGEAAAADDDDDDDDDDDRPPIMLPGMVPQPAASAAPADASAAPAVLPLPRPAAATAASVAARLAAAAAEGQAPAAASDPDDLLATINALDDERDDVEDEDEDEEATAAAAVEQPEEDAGPEAVVPFSLDPTFDYENVKLTERFNVERALKEGEYYDKGTVA